MTPGGGSALGLRSAAQAEDEAAEVPGHEGGKEEIGALEEAQTAARPAVNAQEQGCELHEEKAAERGSHPMNRLPNQGIGLLDAGEEERQGGHDVQSLEVGVGEEDPARA